jgi:hypothetical protein
MIDESTYYIRIPLRYLVPPDQQHDGQAGFNAKVKSILADIARGHLPSWVINHHDLASVKVEQSTPTLPPPLSA